LEIYNYYRFTKIIFLWTRVIITNNNYLHQSIKGWVKGKKNLFIFNPSKSYYIVSGLILLTYLEILIDIFIQLKLQSNYIIGQNVMII